MNILFFCLLLLLLLLSLIIIIIIIQASGNADCLSTQTYQYDTPMLVSGQK